MNGILHRDISPSNPMVYKNADGEWIGVLNDYDLSSTRQDGSGNELTWTVSFMAIDLLREQALEGKVENLYQHDAESLIWVLAWVCLRYEDGKLRRNRPLDEWLKAYAKQCREKKNDSILVGRNDVHPSPSHEAAWDVAQVLPYSLFSCLCCLKDQKMSKYVFSTWLEVEVKLRLKALLVESM